MATWSDLGDVIRLYPKLLPMFRLARREAEALVYRFGAEGVAVAREQERQALSEPLPARLYAWLVRLLAQQDYELLTRLDTASRYEVLANWRSRPGQMIG